MVQLSKRDQILETAGKLFIKHGFQAVSVEQIAAAVPVSKPTLYAHFEDKRDLFVAVMGVRCDRALAALKEGIGENVALEEGLHGFGHQFLELLLAPGGLQLHRVIMAESANFPEMAQKFYETGPKRMHSLLVEFLENAKKDKNIVIEDPVSSADIFISMLKGRTHLKFLLGVEKIAISAEEREKHIAAVVKIFLNGHRP